MSTRRVFNNAELLGLILTLADTSTCAHLVSTSKAFLKQGIVHIWKTLPTAKPLLLLIPGTEEVKLRKNEYTIRLPPPPADFSRFDVYAPLVHSLAIFGPGKTRDRFNIDSSWQTLIFRARNSPLLPNLKEFMLNHSFKKDEEPVLWVSAFVSPSIKSFKASDVKCGLSYVTFSTMSIMLRRLASGCSDLESLTLYLGSSTNIQEETSLLRIVLEDPPSAIWQKFQSLTSLTTDVHALDADSLSSLGELPQLRRLGILGEYGKHFTERLPASTTNAALSKKSFFQLRRLTIRRLHFDDVMVLWGLKPLVERITQLDLYAPSSGDEAAAAEQLASKFLPVLSSRSPRLTRLHIKFEATIDNPVWLDVQDLDPLSTLKLHLVSLGGICFSDPEGNDRDESVLAERFARLWPNVAVLKLANQRMSMGSLHGFAVFPKLIRLYMDLRWDTGWPVQDPITPAPRNLPLHTLEFSGKVIPDFRLGRVEELAKYLLSFWPNLSHVGYPPGSGVDPKTPSLDMLDFCIRTFRGLAETKKRIVQQYGEEVMGSLISSQLNGL